jgi:DNA polymerase-1
MDPFLDGESLKKKQRIIMMKYELVGTGDPAKIAILCPRLQPKEIEKHYGELLQLGSQLMVCDLYQDQTKKKTSNDSIKEYLSDLIPHLIRMGITFLVVTQPDYFKVLSKQSKTDATIGDIYPSIYPELNVAYLPNYSRIFYDPEKTSAKIDIGISSIIRWFNGDKTPIGQSIIKFEAYPSTEKEILEWLEKLYKMDCDLTCDIEGFSLKHYDAGVGTITFCWNENEGIAFAIDYVPVSNPDEPGVFGIQIKNHRIREALKRFFEVFRRKMIYHNICFDVYVLVYQLFMDHLLDQEGLLYGLDVLLKNWDCSQIITYLATNSCSGNELGLKVQAQEFAGNYAQSDIHDIRKIPLKDLLKYNLTDGLSTWHVFNKNKPIMVADDQVGVYHQIFRPAVVDIIQMQLTGMPINMVKVIALNKILEKESENHIRLMNNIGIVQSFIDYMLEEYVKKKNSEYKKKVITKADVKPGVIFFNPGSPKQLQDFLYSEDFLGLPVLDYTDTKLPATGAETLEKLIHHTTDPEIILFLNILIEYKASAIILSTFLPAFLQAQKGDDGWHYLFGNFRLGGTASGRLSSNNPNLQNIPSSGSTKAKQRLAKMIKECFEAPPGWLFCGLDFDSLEDKISAVTTRDPEKIKVYTDGYDGHCLRAFAYFGEHMPDIQSCPPTATAYKATVGDNTFYFHSEEKVEYLGKDYLGSELFELLKK